MGAGLGHSRFSEKLFDANGNIKSNEAELVKTAKESADNDQREAIVWLAKYYDGEGGNKELAVKYYTMAAARGSMDALLDMRKYYYYGGPVESKDIAREWLEITNPVQHKEANLRMKLEEGIKKYVSDTNAGPPKLNSVPDLSQMSDTAIHSSQEFESVIHANKPLYLRRLNSPSAHSDAAGSIPFFRNADGYQHPLMESPQILLPLSVLLFLIMILSTSNVKRSTMIRWGQALRCWLTDVFLYCRSCFVLVWVSVVPIFRNRTSEKQDKDLINSLANAIDKISYASSLADRLGMPEVARELLSTATGIATSAAAVAANAANEDDSVASNASSSNSSISTIEDEASEPVGVDRVDSTSLSSGSAEALSITTWHSDEADSVSRGSFVCDEESLLNYSS